MDIRDTSDVIKALNAAASGNETWRVERFVMERSKDDATFQEVVVEILDRGPDISPRYHVAAQTKDGTKSCTGNSGDDLETVIATVHWYQLDR